MTALGRSLAVGAAAVLALALAALAITSGIFAPESIIGSTTGVGKAAEHSTLAPIPDAPPRSAQPLYWGVYVENKETRERAPWDMTALTAFDQLVDKRPSLVGFSSPFANCKRTPCRYYDFPTTPMQDIRDYGAIPFFSWGAEAVGVGNPLEQPRFQLADVAAGHHDSYIRKFANDARLWGYPFFLRFNWEMNGDWFVWSEQRNDNQPGDFIKAWRHVHDLFEEVGVTNATWVWCPNVDPYQNLQEISLLYPGDRYVDWTCLDGYNWGVNNPVVERRPWSSFGEIFDEAYRKVTEQIAPNKPMVVGEFATSDYGGDKAAWIRDALIRIPTHYPRIRGLVWFNIEDRETHWPIENSPAAVEAFRSTLKSPIYLHNLLGQIAASPIPPPTRN
jgi:hypothetical protein